MTTIYDSTRPRQARSRRRPFGRGVFPSEPRRQPYTQADLDWAAAALNADSDCYIVTGYSDAELERRAAESAYYDQFAADVRRGTGVRLDVDEEGVRYGVEAARVDEDGFPIVDLSDEYSQYQAAMSLWVDGRGPRPV